MSPYVDILRPLWALHVHGVGDVGPTGLLAAVGSCVNLRHLGIVGRDYGGPHSLPASFGALQHVTSLVLSGTGLSNDGLEPLFGLSGIQELDLSNNQHITALPDDISRLVSLRSLGLWRSNVRVLPDHTSDLTGLRELSWSNRYHVTGEPAEPALHVDNLHQLRGLQCLRIAGYQPNQLPLDMAWPPALTQLQVQLGWNIHVPHTISTLVGLERLMIGVKEVVARPLPQGLEALTCLTWLQLCGWKEEALQEGMPPALHAILRTHPFKLD
jgi:Leucine-rich repeat (LRR) protein